MLRNLEEFNQELTELEGILGKINKLPKEFQDMMMSKFKKEVLSNETMDNQVVEQPKTCAPVNTHLKRILRELPLLTDEEAQRQVEKIRGEYKYAPRHRRLEMLSEIPSLKRLIQQTGYSDTTIRHWLNNQQDKGVINKIPLVPYNEYNSPSFYYKIKKEDPVKDDVPPVYGKNSNPYKGHCAWVITRNNLNYTWHSTQAERDEAYRIGEETNWDKARMYKLPNYVLYDGDNSYSVFIPKTNKLILEKVNLQVVKGFVEWINEAKNYNGGRTVHFHSYWQVSVSKTKNGAPSWQYRYDDGAGRIRRIYGRTLKKLEEHMLEKGFKLTKTFGEIRIDLEKFIS